MKEVSALLLMLLLILLLAPSFETPQTASHLNAVLHFRIKGPQTSQTSPVQMPAVSHRTDVVAPPPRCCMRRCTAARYQPLLPHDATAGKLLWCNHGIMEFISGNAA